MDSLTKACTGSIPQDLCFDVMRECDLCVAMARGKKQVVRLVTAARDWTWFVRQAFLDQVLPSGNPYVLACAVAPGVALFWFGYVADAQRFTIESVVVRVTVLKRNGLPRTTNRRPQNGWLPNRTA